MSLLPIILAAGQGTRMKSALPKVLHQVAGKPMLQHVIDACESLQSSQVAVVYGHGGEQVKTTVKGKNLQWALQAEQLGTGHAVKQAIHLANDNDIVVIAYGDVPLIRAETLKNLAEGLGQASLCILTTTLADPKGYGRIVRDDNENVVAITEEKDATDEVREIKEVNTGFMAARGQDWKRWLEQLNPQNAQGEYYLTDCVGLAVSEGWMVSTVHCDDPIEVEGANNRIQLARLERAAQQRQVEALMLAGAALADPSRVDIRGKVTVGRDVFIDVNTVFKGNVVLGDNVTIEPNCVISNTHIAAGSHIKANSVLEDAEVGKNNDIGPFARIRPGTVLDSDVKIGNFVETKKAIIGQGSKVNHLSYVGDAILGADVNIGAGTITCNYDGANKFKTIIGDRVFVGSSTQLVAPVTVGNGATIGAGSTIAKDVKAESLALTRAPQRSVDNWVRPKKEKK